MKAFAGFLVLLGVMGFGAAIILLAVRTLLKKGWAYRRSGILACASMVVFILGMVMAGPSSNQGFDAGRQAARNISAQPDSTQKTEEVTSPTPVKVEQPQKDLANQEAETPKTEEKTEQPIIDIPKILKQDYSGIVQFLGKPLKIEDKDADTKILTYKLSDFDVDIKLFMNNPVTLDITPKKEYKFPDGVMELLSELGLKNVDAIGATSMQKLFTYINYGTPTREYEIRVSSKDWRAVDDGKGSTVNFVYVKLIKTF